MKIKQFIFLLILIYSFAISANAGVEIEARFKTKDRSATGKTYLEDDRVRAEAGNQLFIYRADKKLFWTINKDQRAYRERTDKEQAQILKKIEDFRKKLYSNLSVLPKAEREKLEQEMRANEAKQPSNNPLVYNKVASNQKIGKWNCDKYEITRRKEKVADLWAAKWSDFGLTSNDFKGFQKLARALGYKSFTGSHPDYRTYTKESKINGFPVKRIAYFKNGKTVFWELIRAEKKKLKRSLFELPKGFKKSKNQKR
ncbi:MAG: DUF4412 domain-containing protein [Candidatus Saganbacteria bacterium]|nr:DUF4412 domain-containing protein [Candidatus Saganbacteria bacterium]